MLVKWGLDSQGIVDKSSRLFTKCYSQRSIQGLHYPYITMITLKRKYHHFDEIFINGCTWNCAFDNCRYSKLMAKISLPCICTSAVGVYSQKHNNKANLLQNTLRDTESSSWRLSRYWVSFASSEFDLTIFNRIRLLFVTSYYVGLF